MLGNLCSSPLRRAVYFTQDVLITEFGFDKAMARNSDDMPSLKYEDDPRKECKYGSKCYQKNPVHHKTYKHPNKQKRNLEDNARVDAKKQKLDNRNTNISSSSDDDDDNVKEFNDSDNTNEARKEDIRKDEISEYSDSEPDTPTAKKESEPSNRKNTDGNTAKITKKEQISDSSDSDTSEIPNTPEPANRKEKTVPIPENIAIPQDLLPPKASTNCTNEIEVWNKTIKEKFLVEMPDDFFEFWKFCESLSKTHPADALRSVGLLLVGPYDLIAGKLNGVQPNGAALLTHWRYYYDVPEFQTVLKGDDKLLFHIGYFRDDPKEAPCFLAGNSAAKGCVITPLGDNIFAAVNSYLESSMKTINPFQKMKYTSIQKSVQSWAKKNDFSLSTMTTSMKKRQSKIVTKSFHSAGIVVPVERKTELGYRDLIESDARLKKILKLIVESDNDAERDLCFSKLDPVITAANIANDECDFGTSLELGIDLFCFGGKILERPALSLLVTAYSLLRRPEFSEITKAHLANRREGSNLSNL